MTAEGAAREGCEPISAVPAGHPEDDSSSHQHGLWALALGSLGVVFGDIGTSPLYSLQDCFNGPHGVDPTRANLIGVLSLVVWSLILVVTVKYVLVLMRADNRGEGGIMALLALVPADLRKQASGAPGVAALMVMAGASFLYGDGIITPAISVLSAVEGLKAVDPGFGRFVVPITVVILIGLFGIQSHGTGRLAGLFGPVMVVWFLTAGLLGVPHILHSPEILEAFLPTHALGFLLTHGWHGVVLLGSVVLVVTGGEALYADMGHFGRTPIRMAWLGLALPCLMLSYLGQGALMLRHPEARLQPFFSMLTPGPWTYALVLLATMATVIASQALISAVFSLTHQAIRLGYFPRIMVYHTSTRVQGQIYVPLMNWAVGLACLALVLIFKSSSALAAAFGLAVSATMALTSIVFFFVTRHHWHWPLWKSLLVTGGFLCLDLPFLVATSTKFMLGGYLPIIVAAFVFVTMLAWTVGREELTRFHAERSVPLEAFLERMPAQLRTRIPGLCVILVKPQTALSTALLFLVTRLHVLHEHVFLVSVTSEAVPTVPLEDQVDLCPHGQGIYTLTVHCGFTDYPDVPRAVELARQRLNLSDVSIQYMTSRENFLSGELGRMNRLLRGWFVFLAHNATNVTHYLGLPSDQTAEVGTRVEL